MNPGASRWWRVTSRRAQGRPVGPEANERILLLALRL
jgi:hypothetical protein